MKNNKNNENNEPLECLDIDFKSLEIIVPPELDQKIKDRIRVVKLNKSRFKYALTASILFVILLVNSVLFIPKVNVFAKDIFFSVVQFIAGDIGTENAKNNNYQQNTGLVTVTRNGNSVNINDVIIDEERMIITGNVTGPKIQMSSTETDPVGLQIYLKEFSNTDTSLTVQTSDNKMDFKLEKDMNIEEVEQYLSLKKASINIDLNIVKHNQQNYTEDDEHKKLEKFDSIKIPIDLQSIKKSVYFICDNNINVDNNQINLKLKIKSLVISPTRMRLTLVSQSESSTVIGLINPYIRDEEGITYSESTGFGLFQMNDKNEISLNFNPSVYFKEMNQKLYFGFKGILINGDKAIKNEYEVQLNFLK